MNRVPDLGPAPASHLRVWRAMADHRDANASIGSILSESDFACFELRALSGFS
jgi:hypothetical protein